jgi:hypothetical protein
VILRPDPLSDTSADGTGCNVDVNGDGKANGVLQTPAGLFAIDEQLEKKRLGFNASLQGELGAGLRLLGDFFYTKQDSYDRQTGYQLNAANWDGATFIPINARNTGVQVYNGYNGADGGAPLNDFYVAPQRQFYMGDIETYSDDNVTNSTSRNFNLELAYNNCGNLTGELRGIYATASELHMESYLQFAVSDGSIWKNSPTDALPPPVPPPPTPTWFRAIARIQPYGFAPEHDARDPEPVGRSHGDHAAELDSHRAREPEPPLRLDGRLRGRLRPQRHHTGAARRRALQVQRITR